MQSSLADPDTAYSRLAEYLAADPQNFELIADCADAAIASGRGGEAQDLIARLRDDIPRKAHLVGMLCLYRSQWRDAADAFAALLDRGYDMPASRFNAAWAHAMLGEHDHALALVDLATAEALAAAAALRINLLHARGALDQALSEARRLLEFHPADRTLNATIATLAIDQEDYALAQACSLAGGDHPEALTARATLLFDDHPEQAMALFDDALSRNPGLTRARIGRGLVRLSRRDVEGAVADLDAGAEAFATHLGSWLAAGWAHVLAGRPELATARFESALCIDDRFAEAHGSLAVLDVLGGRLGEARRRATVARRLDAASFAAALAELLLLEAEGSAERAKALRTELLHRPLDDTGRTIAGLLTRSARSPITPN